jgi:hypothetical protein
MPAQLGAIDRTSPYLQPPARRSHIMTDSRSASQSWCQAPIFLLKISFRQLRVYYFVATSLTRGRVCHLLYNCFWALPEQSLIGRSPAEITAIFYCLIWDFPNLEAQVPVFISPRNRVAQLYPRALGSPFVVSYDTQGSGGGIPTRLHMGKLSAQTQDKIYKPTTKQTIRGS